MVVTDSLKALDLYEKIFNYRMRGFLPVRMSGVNAITATWSGRSESPAISKDLRCFA